METKEILNPKTITKKCVFCGKEVSLVVDELDYMKYEGGMHVQDCFPYLTPGERELFISGICSSCFDETFKEDECCQDNCKACEAEELPEKIITPKELKSIEGDMDKEFCIVNRNADDNSEMLGYSTDAILRIAAEFSKFCGARRNFGSLSPLEVFMVFLKSEEFRALNIKPTVNFYFLMGKQFPNIMNLVMLEHGNMIPRSNTMESVEVSDEEIDAMTNRLEELLGSKNDGK